jgi:TrmH family RNA methyltransferase
VLALYVGGDASPDLIRRATGAGATVHELPDDVLRRTADTMNTQGVLAVVEFTPAPLATLEQTDLAVLLVDVRDPGNAGTLLRSAEGAGAGAVLFTDGSVDVTSPKTVRASAGAVFGVPVVAGCAPEEVLALSARIGQQRLGATAHGGRAYETVDFTRPTTLVFGNEAHGLREPVTGLLDAEITIPLEGRAESLNVGMAATVLLFETRRQRRALTQKRR